MLQAQAGTKQPVGNAKGKGKGKGKGKKRKDKSAMASSTSKTFEELIDCVPQDTFPYLVTEVWTSAGCPSSEAAVGTTTAGAEIEWPAPTGCDRFGNPQLCHAGDGCARSAAFTSMNGGKPA